MTSRRYTEKQVDDWLAGILRNFEYRAEIRSRYLDSQGEWSRDAALDRLEEVIDDIGMIRRKWREYNRMLAADASRDIRRD